MCGGKEWNAAVERLFGERCALVLTGPRGHADWLQDVLAVLAREVGDPRGWTQIDRDVKRSPERVADNRIFPFSENLFTHMSKFLFEIGRESAAQLLVTLTDDWYSVRGIPDFEERRDELLADARTLLARYGPDSVFRTPAPVARTDKNPDFFGVKASAGGRFTDYVADLGLIAVSDAEVGVFWTFNPS
ncbi:hypothetical protein [Streptomyces caatingaensis]|uniref:Uncharacterized protein n=1 Tax=Streptomyces caatingaensis TaxID=1678637 RepID=A0A0K9XAQ1_9ACTN|nr:hypothetical protein [Streptomyces caatingaensis]KNB50156.1 hypothetical protein AC230_26030 [Streptomyces caatingaensis]